MISVVTITYNNFEELVATCNSLGSQSDIEHVIINGGDCKKTLAFLHDYSPSFKSVIISENDSGIYDAFNKGVRASSGPLIHFLNSGDLLIDELYYQEVNKVFTQRPGAMAVHADIIFTDPIAGKIRIKPTLKSLGRGLNFNHPTFICKKDVFNLIGYFNTAYRYAGDFEWAIRFEKHRLDSIYLKALAVEMDGSGVSTTQEGKSILECFNALRDNRYLGFETSCSFAIRLVGFFSRKILRILGLLPLIRLAKRKKHHL
tara:strand:- start:79038 stop:79814 length:777 start_codon:yes stop_codon:yes gene_type:complete